MAIEYRTEVREEASRSFAPSRYCGGTVAAQSCVLDNASSAPLPLRLGRTERSFLYIAAGPWMEPFVVTTALLAYFATPLLALRLLTDWQPSVQVLAAAAVAVVCAALTAGLSRRLPTLLSRPLAIVDGTPLWAIILLGLLLRAAWHIAFPAQPASDAATYLSLASRLAAGEPYFISGTAAYWPVGYPLYLSAWVAALGPGKPAWLISNFFLYLLAVAGIAHLSRTLSGSTAAKLAALLFAAWPNFIANTATPEKEMLLVALLPWVTTLVLSGLRSPNSSLHTAAAGALLGACVLVQPSLQFLPIALAIFLVGIVPNKKRALMRALVLVFAAAATVAPWTIRNYYIFDRFVLVSTNGGSNLYRANNPLATGGYIRQGAVDLSNLSEIERDLQGRALAMEWITSHPQQFGRLAFEKQVRFTGDDAAGVYVTLKLGMQGLSEATYAIFKGAANTFWILVWMTLAAACLVRRKHPVSLSPLLRFPLWLWLYLFAMHSVFESAGKYHIPASWTLCVLLAGYAVAVSQARP